MYQLTNRIFKPIFQNDRFLLKFQQYKMFLFRFHFQCFCRNVSTYFCRLSCFVLDTCGMTHFFFHSTYKDSSIHSYLREGDPEYKRYNSHNLKWSRGLQQIIYIANISAWIVQTNHDQITYLWLLQISLFTY